MKRLEDEAMDWCFKKDEELGELWSNDYEELPFQISNFVRESKWVQAEKIKAKIEQLNQLRIHFNEGIGFETFESYMEPLQKQLKELENEK
jgi:hypothetical protein